MTEERKMTGPMTSVGAEVIGPVTELSLTGQHLYDWFQGSHNNFRLITIK